MLLRTHLDHLITIVSVFTMLIWQEKCQIICFKTIAAEKVGIDFIKILTSQAQM